MTTQQKVKGPTVSTVSQNRNPCGYQQITSLSSATGLTVPAAGVSPVCARIVPLTQNVRWRDDGTNPTASVGMPMIAGTEYWYHGNLAAIKFIEITSGAQLNVSYYE